MKLVCDLCGGALQVKPGSQEAECKNCGLCYSMEALREKLDRTEQTECPEKPVAAEAFEKPYRIKLEREKGPALRYDVTFILIMGQRPRPLSEEALLCWDSDETRFEIPIYIAKDMDKVFEGVLTGVPDGKDLHIVLGVDPKEKMLGVIKKSSNSTVRFEERAGATDRWNHGQNPKV